MRKIYLLLATLLLLGLVQVTCTQAQLELYDDFSRNRLHPQLWTDARSGAALDERREVRQAVLLLWSRSPKDTSYSLLFKTPAPVTAIRAKLETPRLQQTSCTSAGYPLTRSRVSVGGRFFASTSVSPQKDVGAFADLETAQGSATAVRYRVQYCDDAECVTGTVLHSGSIGTMPPYDTAQLLVDWDGAVNVFRFQVDSQPLVTVGYSISDSATLTIQRKGLQVAHSVPVCPAGQRAEGGVQAYVDDVYVNTGAKPTIVE